MATLLQDVKLLKKSYFECETLPELERDETCTVPAERALNGKIVCLFFSASWCAPCQHFVPTLEEMFTELVRRGEKLEIVFLSFDKTEQEMRDYFTKHHGDWLAVKFGDPLRDSLAERYGVSVIPKLVVVQPGGEVITLRGRKDVQDKGLACLRAWQAGLVTKGDKHEREVGDDQAAQKNQTLEKQGDS